MSRSVLIHPLNELPLDEPESAQPRRIVLPQRRQVGMALGGLAVAAAIFVGGAWVQTQAQWPFAPAGAAFASRDTGFLSAALGAAGLGDSPRAADVRRCTANMLNRNFGAIEAKQVCERMVAASLR